MTSTTVQKRIKRTRRHARVRARMSGTSERPRLSVFRSGSHIYAQLIDDDAGKTIAAASSVELKAKNAKTSQAEQVGTKIAEKGVAKGVTHVVFDRGGYKYHGRVKALAEAARKAGLQF